MFKDDWDALGIEPTGDLLAIKKAYALKLRVTRPDDDAQAYQRLRQAYERAQLRARSSQRDMQIEGDVVPEVHAKAPVSRAPIDASPEALEQAQPETRLEPAIGSAELADWVQRLQPGKWADGPGSLKAWAEIRPQLLSIPLQLQAEASARFADLVIQVRWLPIEIVDDLQKQFAWLDDFRVARLMGPQRLQALHEVLNERIVRPITDPDLLQRFGPLLHLQRLRQQGATLAAIWFAARLGAPLMELSKIEDGRLLRRLGLDSEPRPLFRQLLLAAAALRIAVPLLVLSLLVLPHFIGRHEIVWGLVPIGIVGAAVGLRFVLMVSALIGTASWQGMGLINLPRNLWSRFRVSGYCTVLGLALLAGVTLSNRAIDGGLPMQICAPLWVAGMLLAWPRTVFHGVVALASIAAMVMVLNLPPFGIKEPASLACWAPLWVLCGAAVHGQSGEIAKLSILFRPITNGLRLADGFGYKLALVPACVVLVMPLLIEGMAGTWLYVVWALSILGIFKLQACLAESAIRQIDPR